MKETNELLENIYEDAEMASYTLTILLKELKNKDNKIKGDVEDILKEYEKYTKEAKALLKKHKIKPEKTSMMARLGAKEGIKANIKKDNSDSKISDIVIQGLVMGIIDITKKIDSFDKEANKDIVQFANKLLKFQEKSVEKLKEYL